MDLINLLNTLHPHHRHRIYALLADGADLEFWADCYGIGDLI